MRTLLPGVFVLVLLTAACGGEGGGSGDDQPLGVGRAIDVCSLVTEEEAAQWLGEPVSAAPTEGLDGEPDPVTCLYEGATGSVLVQVYDGEVFFADEGSDARVGDDIAGLGEDAYGDGSDVDFLQNDWSVSVSQIMGTFPEGTTLEMAQIVSGRLP